MGKEQIAGDGLASELLLMLELDQGMRRMARQDLSRWDDGIDLQNTARLEQIVADVGWPTISMVGEEASNAAWLIVQHSTHESEFMEECLVLMKMARPGDVYLSNIAHLEDRILAFSGKPQIYGTQFRQTIDGL